MTNSQFNFRSIGRGSTSRKCDLVEPLQSPKSYLSTKLSKIRIPELSTLGVGETSEVLSQPLTKQCCPDMQKLQWWSEAFMGAIIQSTRRMPYSMRFIARETLLSLRVCQKYSLDCCIAHVGSGKIPWCTGQGLRRMYRKAGFLQIHQPGYPVCSILPASQLFLTPTPALRRLLIWSPQLTSPRGRISHRYLRC